MARHIAQEQTLGEKISQYIVIRQKNQFDMWIQELVSRRKRNPGLLKCATLQNQTNLSGACLNNSKLEIQFNLWFPVTAAYMCFEPIMAMF